MDVRPVALMVALLAKLREASARKDPRAARFRCRFCHEHVGPGMSEVEGHATHPLNSCRFGRRAHGAIPRSAAEPIGFDLHIKGRG